MKVFNLLEHQRILRKQLKNLDFDLPVQVRWSQKPQSTHCNCCWAGRTSFEQKEQIFSIAEKRDEREWKKGTDGGVVGEQLVSWIFWTFLFWTKILFLLVSEIDKKILWCKAKCYSAGCFVANVLIKIRK